MPDNFYHCFLHNMVIFYLGNNGGYAVIEQRLVKRVKFEMFGKNF